MALRRGMSCILPRLSQPLQLLPAPVAVSSWKLADSLAVAQPSQTFKSNTFSDFWRTYSTDIVAPSTPKSLTDKLTENPTSHIMYDEHKYKRYPPSNEKHMTAYFIKAGGRFVYASALRLALIKIIVSLSAAADTLAMASLEVDLGSIPEGQTVTVKWRGKPVFIRHRTDEEIAEAADIDMKELRDQQQDVDRAVNPKYLIVVGVCTHLGCVPISDAGDYHGWFCPCHGSHYDISGRIRKGPAPYNLEVPEYKFVDDTKVIIG